MSGYGSILWRRWVLVVLLSVTLLLFVLGKPVSGATKLPDGFTDLPVASGLANPTAMEFAPDGRLFVAEKGGRLRVIDENDENNVGLQTEPFVDISD